MSGVMISEFTMHGTNGVAVPVDGWADWVSSIAEWVTPQDVNDQFGDLAYYSWTVDEVEVRISAAEMGGARWTELPDASGFICFEKGFSADNCCLRDVYGKVTNRLTVPWQLTGAEAPPPPGAKMYFIGLRNQVGGTFGVSAEIEYGGGEWYFELDYHLGKFLWAKRIPGGWA